ncbi:unnamed protein product [Paramecium primaurelia]|uniref:Uncharacterized protein n=2 Tax=Paramecium TaxID=5884 RepID=A0A8S1TNK3_9CILI|nr:unnamed protein product [Paramecium primaurelia]CAD8155581.1 unnamed protein product [Paramecium pentaurelia]
MKSNQEFEQEIENLIKESVSKNNSPMRDEGETKGKKQKKQFFYNRNKIDINEAWKEIEKLFESFSIQGKNSVEKPNLGEESKIIEQKEFLQTPQPKVHSPSIQTTKIKESKDDKEKDRINCSATRRLTFNLD